MAAQKMSGAGKTRYIIMLGALAACLGSALMLVSKPVGLSVRPEVISWGLRYGDAGTAPEADPVGTELLHKYNGRYTGDTSRKTVYFTFDLGYEAGYTGKVLDTLRQNEAKAIFFLCGNYLKEEALINRMISEGHTIGNHTDRHKDLPTVGTEAALKDIQSLQRQYVAKYGGKPLFFRPPSGRFNEATLQLVQAQGLQTLMWSVAYADWGKEGDDPDKSTNLLMRRIHPGAVILMHITNKSAPVVLEKLIVELKGKGYDVGAPDDLIMVKS